jgi:hypothetical protein
MAQTPAAVNEAVAIEAAFFACDVALLVVGIAALASLFAIVLHERRGRD